MKVTGNPRISEMTATFRWGCRYSESPSGARGISYNLRSADTALLQKFGDQRGPTSLMAGSHTRAVIAMKIFIEKQEIFPVRVGLKCG